MGTTASETQSFGALLRQHRLAASLSQEVLGERAGLSATAIAALERGRTAAPRPATVLLLADALGLGPVDRAALIDAATGARAGGPISLAGRPPTEFVSKVRGLPAPLTSFIGRERELAEVRRLLETTRLLTLTGAGGIGKTRLALQLVVEQQRLGTVRAALVELGAVSDPLLVPQAVAAALGVPEQPKRGVLEVLGAALRSQELLLVLDNCEHLVEGCAELCYDLLSQCPRLRIVATSREVLGLAGEIAWRVPPLSLPESRRQPLLAEVAASEAVRLFVQRAAAVQPGFALAQANAATIARICHQLDGIPLALELAAARVTVLSVEQLTQRLDDALGVLTAGQRQAPARQQTLRATLDWSYGLLTDAERRLFERLSVFAGSWTLEAAEAVCAGDGIDAEDVLQLLARLVDKSLVVSAAPAVGRVRCRLLEPLRQYARERLVDRGELEVLNGRHAAYFLARAESVQPDLLGRTAMLALDQLDRDHANLRVGLGWLVARGDVDRAQRLAGALGRFWLLRAHFTEGEGWLRQALALPGGERRSAARAACASWLGSLLLAQGEYASAEVQLGEALDLFREAGNRFGEAWTLMALGQAARLRGDRPAARLRLEEGVAVSRAAAQRVPEFMCQQVLADVASEQGNLLEARAHAEAGLAGATAAGWLAAVANAHRVMGKVEFAEGNARAARVHLEASLVAARELGSDWLSTEALARLGPVAIKLGDIEPARAYLIQSLQAVMEHGHTAGMLRAEVCLILEGFAQLGVMLGQDRDALEVAGAASALRDRWNVPPSPTERRLVDQALAQAGSRLGVEAAEQAQTRGASLTLEQALSVASRLGGFPPIDAASPLPTSAGPRSG